jgi:hypothetical protein
MTVTTVSTSPVATGSTGAARESGVGRGLVVAAALLLASVLLVPLSAVRLPAAGAEVALVFAPGTARDAALGAVVAAGGQPVRAGALEPVLIVRFPQALGWREVWRLGAWAALDPLAFGGCLVAPESASPGFVSNTGPST